MSNLSFTPSLDQFLRINALSMASFASKTVNEALCMCGLDDRALAALGDAHRDR
jgi:hypothetical protein